MEYALRPAIMADYRFCHALTRQNMSEMYQRHWGSWEAFAFQDGFVPENVRILLCDDRSIGFVSASIRQDTVYLDNIQLVSDKQGQGIGTWLLTDFMTRHPDSNVILTTFEDNPATRLYARLGFTEVAREGAAIIMQRRPGLR